MLNRARTVQHALGGKVSLMRLLWGVKGAEKYAFLANVYTGNPRPVTGVYTKEAACIVTSWLASVLRVMGVRYVAQVCNSVVSRVTINVVNLIGWPASINVQPRKTVTLFRASINLDSGVPVFPDAPCGISGAYPVGCPDDPCKHAGIWVVGKKLLKTGCGQFIGWIAGSLSKVFNPVVNRTPVDMHQSCSGARPKDVKPYKLTGGVNLALNPDRFSFCASCSAGHISRLAITIGNFPEKVSGFRVVMKKLFEPFLREGMIQISHAVSPVKKWFGQRPRCVSSTSGPRHFTIGAA